MASQAINDIMAQVTKQYGPNIVMKGNADMGDCERQPTGIFPLDLAIGGGFPAGKVVLIYGPESSGKTNISLKAIASGQRKYPDKVAVFVDAESSYDKEWAATLGVDTTRLIVVSPTHTEEAIDLIMHFFYVPEVFSITLDSVAALATQNEIESSADKASVGGSSNKLGGLFRKIAAAQSKYRREGKVAPTFVGINQLRMKIGVMFGNPETIPGGAAQKYASSLSIRVYGKNKMDKAIHPIIPAFKDTSVVVQKWKQPILNTNCVFDMLMVQDGETPQGTVADWNTICKYLQELKYLTKGDKKGWVLDGEVYGTLTDVRDHIYSDPDLLQSVRDTIISELMGKKAIAPTESSEEEES